jgi:Tfp pilus assembly protein PilX
MISMSGKQKSQQGMVSILVTMIMMLVITLIIIGLSQITRSNQREQLDQQLSTQAYYAAESGLNQAAEFFAANPTQALNTNGNCTQFITSSSPSGLGLTLGTGNVLDNASNTRYTCLMVNSTPTTLQKAPLTEDSNTVWRVKDAGGANFTELKFRWSANGKSRFTGASNTCSNTNFPTSGNWNCAFGILRVDLVPTGGTVASSVLEGNATGVALYLVPTFSASGVASVAASGDRAQAVNVKCVSATNLCDLKMTIAGGSSEYYMRLTMLYQSADSVQLAGTDASGAAKFSGGQAVIDVTGKAQDELRRVQARIPLTQSTGPLPAFGLQTTDTLCKQYNVADGVDAIDHC